MPRAGQRTLRLAARVSADATEAGVEEAPQPWVASLSDVSFVFQVVLGRCSLSLPRGAGRQTQKGPGVETPGPLDSFRVDRRSAGVRVPTPGTSGLVLRGGTTTHAGTDRHDGAKLPAGSDVRKSRFHFLWPFVVTTRPHLHAAPGRPRGSPHRAAQPRERASAHPRPELARPGRRRRARAPRGCRRLPRQAVRWCCTMQSSWRRSRSRKELESAFTRYGATGLSEPSIWVGGRMLHKQYIEPFHPMNALQTRRDAICSDTVRCGAIRSSAGRCSSRRTTTRRHARPRATRR